jgi:hypothetical protein
MNIDVISHALGIDGKLDVPVNLSSIKIDIGLAGEAPTSALWLSNHTNRFVIGIEPLAYHWKMLNNFETSESKRPYPYDFAIVQLEEGVVKKNKQNICNIGNRFCKIHCAIDDVDKPTKKKFYQMDRKDGASGSSSLLKPTSNHPHFIEEEIYVDVISLAMILDHVDWERFPFIEHIKTDCEGHDFSVVKSIGDKYFDKILFISSEMSISNKTQWENTYDHEEYIRYMDSKGFDVIFRNNQDVIFMNRKLKKIADLFALQMQPIIHGQ